MKGHLFYNSMVSSPWAATPECVQHLHEVYWRIVDRKATGEDLDIEALAKELGRPLDNTRRVETRNRTAVIPIEGKIMPKADFFTDVSGMVTVDVLARDFNTALNNPAVDSILLIIDSPGGQIGGINEFADMIYAARDQKPIVAYVPNQAASAAYWIASAADEIVIDRAALLGSIGVIGVVPDPTKQNARDIKFVSSQSPKKRPDPTTTEGASDIQSEIDALAAVFIDAIARNRGVNAETVTDKFGKGAQLVGAAAVSAGLADRIGSREQVIAELSSGNYSKKRRPRMAASSQSTGGAHAANQDQEHNAMSTEKKTIWQRLFNRDLSAEEKTELAAELNTGSAKDHRQGAQGLTGAQAAAGSPGDSQAVAGLQTEIDRLKAQVIEQRKATLKAEAEAFINAKILAAEVLPAVKDGFVAALVQAGLDDADSPIAEGKSRVEMLKAQYEGRDKHQLTGRTVKAPQGARVLEEDAGDAETVKPERRKELLTQSELGRAALSAKKD